MSQIETPDTSAQRKQPNNVMTDSIIQRQRNNILIVYYRNQPYCILNEYYK